MKGYCARPSFPPFFLDVSSASAGSLGLFADLRLSESINPSTQKSGKVEGNLEHWPSADAHQRGKNETEIVEMEKKRQVQSTVGNASIAPGFYSRH